MIKKKVLVIVAHPDDETIWMGGTLIRNKRNWDTTTICMCRKGDEDRCPKFIKACKILGVKPFIFDLDDTKLKPLSSKSYIKILKNFPGKNYDYIFTHGENGEYGHIRHKEIHKVVKEVLKKGLIKAKKVFFFSYVKRKNNFQGYAEYDSSANIFIKLNHDEILLKKKIIKNVYGYQRGGFEEKSAAEIESFLK